MSNEYYPNKIFYMGDELMDSDKYIRARQQEIGYQMQRHQPALNINQAQQNALLQYNSIYNQQQLGQMLELSGFRKIHYPEAIFTKGYIAEGGIFPKGKTKSDYDFDYNTNCWIPKCSNMVWLDNRIDEIRVTL